MINEEKPIKKLKIIYDGKTYDKILYFNIHNTNEYSKYEVNFTNKKDDKETVNINCMLSEIEIITK